MGREGHTTRCHHALGGAVQVMFVASTVEYIKAR